MSKVVPTLAGAMVAGMLGLASSAHAAPITYTAMLSGLNEAMPNASPGTGFAKVTVDEVANTMFVEVTFADLTEPNTAAHIHCCTAAPLTGTAGVATVTPTFPSFPAGTSGTYAALFELVPFTATDTYNPAFVTAHGGTSATAAAALLAGLASGSAYFNIHTATYSAGEIRGFLVPESTSVPEPATLSLIGVGVLAALRRARRR